MIIAINVIIQCLLNVKNIINKVTYILIDAKKDVKEVIMAIIIGAGTQVEFRNDSCVVSANWGYNPNTQRLYCIGDWSPSFQYDKPTQTLSIVIYSETWGSQPAQYSTAPTVACEDANRIEANVYPAGCDLAITEITGSWFVVSYGYGKDDPLLPGQETWGLQRWVGDNTPTYVLRGITEGQGTIPPDDADPGITFTGVTTESESGSVSAGSIGRADTLRIGTISAVGNGDSTAGVTGQGSASMPYTPLWI